MRAFELLFLAAVVAAVPQFGPDPGADADDSWSIGEIAETATLIVDRISEAKKFLADLDDDQFDFQEWYDQQLEDFKADQDNVAYDDPEDAEADLEDFTQQLNAISTEFAASQGEDYANFVRDIIGEGIDHLNHQSQELLARMRETAQDINDLEEQEFDLYVQLSKISCITEGQTVIQVSVEGENNPVEWPKTLKYTDPADPLDPEPRQIPIAPRSTCYLDSVREEWNEYVKKFNKAGNTSTTKNKYRRKLQKAAKQYNDYVRKWRKLMKTFKDVQAKEEHEEAEYEQYEHLLQTSQTLEEFGMQGSDALVLNDNKLGAGDL